MNKEYYYIYKQAGFFKQTDTEPSTVQKIWCHPATHTVLGGLGGAALGLGGIAGAAGALGPIVLPEIASEMPWAFGGLCGVAGGLGGIVGAVNGYKRGKQLKKQQEEAVAEAKRKARGIKPIKYTVTNLRDFK